LCFDSDGNGHSGYLNQGAKKRVHREANLAAIQRKRESKKIIGKHLENHLNISELSQRLYIHHNQIHQWKK